MGEISLGEPEGGAQISFGVQGELRKVFGDAPGAL